MDDAARTEEQTVIVVGSGTGGLAVIRSLGRRTGIRIVASTHKKHAIGWASKYVDEKVRIPNAATEEQEFVDFFLSRGEQWNGALIMEITDDAAMALSRHKEELSRYYHIVTADWDVLQHFLEKSALYQLADECGVPHPKTFNPGSLEEIEEVAEQVRYPCIIKPVYSHELVAAFDTKMFHADRPEELSESFRKCFDAGIQVMIQEIVVGPESNLERLQTYVDRTGKVISRFFNNKVRQHPPNFGVMRVGVSDARNREVEELADRLLTHGNYRGYASIEFKRDSRDGQLYLIEINVRMPRSGWLAVSSGVDFPWIAFSDVLRGESIDVADYTEGLYWIELFPEIRNLLPRRGEKWMGWRDFLRPYLAKHRTFAVLSFRDPGPFLSQTWHAVLRILRIR